MDTKKTHQNIARNQQQNVQVTVSAREPLNGKVDSAKVITTDTSSGAVLYTKRVVLLADT